MINTIELETMHKHDLHKKDNQLRRGRKDFKREKTLQAGLEPLGIGDQSRGKSIPWKLNECTKAEKVIAYCFTLRWEMARIKDRILGLRNKSLK